MIDQIFISPHMKRSVISNKHGIYELPNELPTNFRKSDLIQTQRFKHQFINQHKNFKKPTTRDVLLFY